jgi:ribose transport system permease protein
MNRKRALEHVAQFQSLFALALLLVAMSLFTSRFLTVDNGLNVLRQISINLFLSIGMTLVILSGGIYL